MLHAEDNFRSPKGIIDEKLLEFTSSPWITFALTEELVEYMKYNSKEGAQLVIAVIDDELCFCRLKEE